MAANATQARGSFTALRLFAALCVFHSHHFIINGLSDPYLPIFVGGLGTFGVYVFFAISGHLVGGSALYRNPIEFVWARFLRIQPALTLCICVTVLLGAVITTAPADQYFAQPLSSLYLFNNINIAWAPAVFRLPYVLTVAPDQSVNTSLWTIPYEVFCYLIIMMSVLVHRWGVLVATVAIAVLVSVNMSNGIWMGSAERHILSIYNQFDIAYIGNFALIFFVAASLNFTTPKQMVAAFAFGVIGSFAAGDNTVVREPFLMVSLATSVIIFGKYIDLDRYIHKLGDISYGFYLYAYPAQQLATHFIGHGGGVNFYLTYSIALISAGAAAKVSWEVIEAPCLTLKDLPRRHLERLMERFRHRGKEKPSPPR